MGKEANRRDQFLEKLIQDNIGSKTRVLQNKKLQEIPSASEDMKGSLHSQKPWGGAKDGQSNISIHNSNDWF